jgi:archaellum component FlaF (FlaF/FlaG flagellin family)
MLFHEGMRPRLLIACVAAACLLGPAASAHAAAKPTTLLQVKSCEVGDTARQRSATYYARMYAVKGTNQMAIRFTLINRAGDGPPAVVDSPALAQWRKSKPGVVRFGYSQSVAGLESGGVYAVQVQFRWINARGNVIRSVKRTSDTCRQQGELPNLSITRVVARAGASSGTEVYAVDMTNSGQGPAHFAGIALFVDGAGVDGQTVDLVKPGETVTIRFTGPTCKRSLRMVADKGNTVAETNEDDNVLRSRCPVLGG